MKFSFKCIYILLIAICSTQIAMAQDDWGQERAEALEKITVESLHREISFLTDSLCDGRATGTRGNIEAAFWIARKFKSAGLLPLGNGYGLHFTTQNGTTAHNIAGMLPGAYSVHREDYIIVGAHFDHLGQLSGKLYPGADANASGTVAMVTIADMLASMREMGRVYDSNIIFVAFDAKEMNMAGSQALWKLIDYGLLTDPWTGKVISKEKVRLMVNIDQIGSSLSPIRSNRKDYMLMLGNWSLDTSKRDNIDICNLTSGIGLDLCQSYYGSQAFTETFYRLSDHKVFVENKIPSVFFTSGITMNTNKTWDRAENLDIPVLRKRIVLICHWLESML